MARAALNTVMRVSPGYTSIHLPVHGSALDNVKSGADGSQAVEPFPWLACTSSRESVPVRRMAERNSSSDGGCDSGPGWETLGRLEAQRGALQQAANAAEAGQAAASSLLTECKQDLARQQQVESNSNMSIWSVAQQSHSLIQVFKYPLIEHPLACDCSPAPQKAIHLLRMLKSRFDCMLPLCKIGTLLLVRSPNGAALG